jgi:hypothetical protein
MPFGVKKSCPFHIVKSLNEALDEVRKAEHNKAHP